VLLHYIDTYKIKNSFEFNSLNFILLVRQNNQNNQSLPLEKKNMRFISVTVKHLKAEKKYRHWSK